MTAGASTSSRDLRSAPTGSGLTRTARRRTPTTISPALSGRSTALGSGAARSDSTRTPSGSRWTASWTPVPSSGGRLSTFCSGAGTTITPLRPITISTTPGIKGAAKDFASSPYFHFIPWDYDNCLGIDYFGTQWQYARSSTGQATHGATGGTGIPRISRWCRNLLRNHDYRQYYLDYIEYMLDTESNPSAFAAQIGAESEGGLWDRFRQAAYLESDTPHGLRFTGRSSATTRSTGPAVGSTDCGTGGRDGGHCPLRPDATRQRPRAVEASQADDAAYGRWLPGDDPANAPGGLESMPLSLS